MRLGALPSAANVWAVDREWVYYDPKKNQMYLSIWGINVIKICTHSYVIKLGVL